MEPGGTGVAVRLVDAVIDIGDVVGIGGGAHRVLHEVDGVIEEESVRYADRDAEFADELGPRVSSRAS